MEIYILQGSCGEYSDRTDWIVRAYSTKEAADADQLKATVQARDFMAAGDRFSEESEDGESFMYSFSKEGERVAKEARERILTVDPSAQFAYTGTTYWVVPAQLV